MRYWEEGNFKDASYADIHFRTLHRKFRDMGKNSLENVTNSPKLSAILSVYGIVAPTLSNSRVSVEPSQSKFWTTYESYKARMALIQFMNG